MFILSYALSGLVRQDVSLAVIAGLCVAAIAVAGLRVAAFACPRCGHPFFGKWYFFKPLSRSCVHCDLPRIKA